jgi:hypothetical protein
MPFCALAQNTFPATGSWREHLPYNSATGVAASSNRIYAATPYSLFTVDPSTKEVSRLSRVSGLAETGIRTITFDPSSQKLFIAYTNSNIDVMDAAGMHNVPGLKRENIPGDKSIYHIYPDNTRAYLSTGLGVLVLNAEKYEILSSWFIGSNGAYVRTNGFTKANGFFYAATEEGLKKTSATGGNPADFRQWQNLSGANGLSAAPAKAVVTLNNRAVVLQNDSLFMENGASWNRFFANGWPIVSINVSQERLLVCQRTASGQSQVLVLGPDASVQRTLQRPGVISFPQQAVLKGDEVWVADLYGGLSKWTGNDAEVFKPNSPEGIASGEMTVYKDVLYAAAGTVNDSWNYQYDPNGIFRLKEGNWANINRFSYPVLDSLLDFITVAADPRDESVWAGSYGGGLAHIRDGQNITIYKQNSSLMAPIGDPGSYRVSGLAFDAQNNLWVSNFGAARPLHVRKADGTWTSFSLPFLLFANAVSQILIDEMGQKWIVSPMGNGLIVFDDNNTIDNLNDDKWRLYRAGAGNGNLPSSDVLSIARDKSGFIWVGTSDGMAVIQCPHEAMQGCEALLPVVKEGNFANYLFKGLQVRGIAVDGADRKWVATSNGAWLVNAAGDQVLEHFTEDNSPLLSNNVRSVTINGRTGEVFFATARGIVSYRAAATEAAEEKGNVLAFPNPVPPGYGGAIAIRGLPENGIFKITELNGRLVYQSRALGGQANWTGRDLKGNKAASGVYLVLTVDEFKTEKAVTKIVFIR